MHQHLRLAVFPVDDRDDLGALERALLAGLDPPLNLHHRPRTALRIALTAARARIPAPEP